MQPSLYLVAGLGKTGHAIARYLRRKNRAFVVFDTRTTPPGLSDFYREFPGVDVFLGSFPETLIPQLLEIMTSPGVSLEDVSLQHAIKQGIPVVGDIECLARELTAPVIAITGTNGKSTVTTLVGEMIAASGKKVAVAGNIGLPVLDLLDDETAYDTWVLELSSFQLETTHTLQPIAATVLNVTPDHLDRHHSMAAYQQAKLRVYRHAKTMIYNRDDPLTYPNDGQKQDHSDGVLVSYGLDAPLTGQWGMIKKEDTYWLSFGQTPVLSVDAMRIKGQHNWQNALAACALAQAAGVSLTIMQAVLQQFSGLPHRTKWVRSWQGVDWINDSKGTNIGATLSAISGIGAAMQGKIVLIAGGQGKGADFTALRDSVADYVRSLILIGEDADILERALTDVVSVVRADTLEDAVNRATVEAKPGDVVLLSPACASLDMFRDFNHRGDVFTALVNAL